VGDAGGDEGRRAGRYRGFLDKHCLSERRALEGRDYGRPRMHTTRAALRPDAEMKSHAFETEVLRATRPATQRSLVLNLRSSLLHADGAARVR
jgi:hypothetical protein